MTTEAPTPTRWDRDAGSRPPVLAVEDLRVEIALGGARGFRAVDRVDLQVKRGEILGLVGESGSGKSMLAKAVMGLLPMPARAQGSIRLEGRELTALGSADIARLRGRNMAMVFQDPMTSLNPVIRIGRQIAEAIALHRDVGPREARQEAAQLLASVGLHDAEARLASYPHELSGGMRQRVMIAMALANRPQLLLADEPTTALDVTVQRQILRLIVERCTEAGTSVVFITHNMGVVASVCSHVAVMYSGRIVEQGPVAELFARPRHPYTWSLLHAVPRLDGPRHMRLAAIAGQAPDPVNPPPGCRFQPRCPRAQEQCSVEPNLQADGSVTAVRCWFPLAAGEALV